MTVDPLAFARRLIDAGVPVFACPPGGPTDGYQLPTGWQTLKADPRRLAVWRPGYALAAVCGHGLDVVDVDPRNGGDEALRGLLAAGLLPRTYAIVSTPRAGRHLYVASLGVAKTKRDGIDLQAGAPDGTGRGFVWLPPTERHGGTYEVLDDSLDAFGQDDDSGARLLAWFHEAKPASAGTSSGPTPARELGTPIPRGAHQETLFKYACSLRARGVLEAEAELLVDLRARDCVPPWGGPDSPWTAVRHAYRYEEGAPPSTGLELVRPPGMPAPTPQAAPAGRPGLRVQWAGDMRAAASRWLWEEQLEAPAPPGSLDLGNSRPRTAQWIPLGGLVLLGGREGIGKSTWAYRLAAQITRGTLPGDLFGDPRPVVIAATEDAWAQTIVPRLDAAGADRSKIARVDSETPEGMTTGLTLPTHTAELAELCREHRVALVLLDPLMGTIKGKIDTHKDAEVRQALEPLATLANECELTIIGLIHQNKSQGGDVLQKLMGSAAFSAVARAVLVCAEEKSELRDSELGDLLDTGAPPRRTFLFGQGKNNLASKVDYSFRYEIEGCRVGFDAQLGKEIWSSRIGASLERVGINVGDYIEQRDAEGRSGRKSPKLDAAKAWLEDFLTAASRPVPSETVKTQGGIAGHGERTLQDAAKALRVSYGLLTDVDGARKTTWALAAAQSPTCTAQSQPPLTA